MRKIVLKCKSVLVGTLLVVCLCSCGKSTIAYVTENEQCSEGVQEQEIVTEQGTEEQSDRILYVYVCGQVQNPGVYTLPEGSRIYDVFELAGGLTENAATDYWNQARLLKDGEMIYVPSKEEAKETLPYNNKEVTGETNDKNKVNINTASKEELMALPGIGEVKALAILAYRQEHGPFSTIEEIKQVEGIKDAVFVKMKPYIEI